ncbi:MAG: helix-turn-helix domain-containing protein [Thermoanaerobaculia bacterium]|nr:helix-turn-helix domain-containing protein [Thermoanaerobaculia bacterium]
MSLDTQTCYSALAARDPRFDGVFFVGVSTTGIYCRPVCPARTPARERCAFFTRAAEAEKAGYRACFRCRPEVAPGQASVDSIPELVKKAVHRIEAGFLNDHSLEDLSRSVGVSSRHLRRAMESQIGVSPAELAQSRRLALAKQLLQDTSLPLTDVAFASGFRSLRRFNATFLERFGRAPSVVRKTHGEASSSALTVRLDYRPPFDWDSLLRFLRGRAIPGVETVSSDEYRRTVEIEGTSGELTVRHAPDRSSLVASVSLSLAPKLPDVVLRLRALFDLDAQPERIASHLEEDDLLRPIVMARPGLRVPGAFDGFELAVRAVLGQQVSVSAATTLSGRLAERFGRDVPGTGRLFPLASRLASSPVEEIRAIGLPGRRAETLRALALAVTRGDLDIEGDSGPGSLTDSLLAIPGIGPWTAQYIVLRVLRWPDAFPAGDLAIRKVLGVRSASQAEERAEAWRPWRAYAVLHLWTSLSQGG